jgi:hypothetical protein
VKNIDRFNEEMEKIAKFNQLFYEPFEYYTQVEKTQQTESQKSIKSTTGKKNTKSTQKASKKTKKESTEIQSESNPTSAANMSTLDLSGLTQEELQALGLVTPKEYVSPWTPYEKIDKAIKTTFKVLKFQEDYSTGHTLVIAYSEKIGLVAFDVAIATTLSGNAENYTIELKNNAFVKIERPNEVLRDMFLIRAIIYVKEGTQVALNRTIPAFFSQMKI